MGARWKITALDVGTSVIEKSILTYLTDCGQKITIPRVMFCLQGETTVVVDTGCRSLEDARVLGEDLTIAPEQEPATALRRIGVEPEDVEVVILTHLHWDHCGNNRLFPRARFYVQRRELQYAMGPDPFMRKAYLSPLLGLDPPFLGFRYEELEGDTKLFDGLEVVLLPGHSPGFQGVLVDTSVGRVLIAGDAIFTYENYEKGIPPGFHWDLAESWRSMQRVRYICDLFIPGHDMAIFREGRTPVWGS